MKNKSEVIAPLMLVGSLYIEFHCITPDSHSALTRLADINWMYLCLVIALTLFISLIVLSYIHDILLYFKFEKEGDITYSFVIALAIFGILVLRNCLIVLSDTQFGNLMSFVSVPIFGVFWSLSKRTLKANRKYNKNRNKRRESK